jgi:hypothetical protein
MKPHVRTAVTYGEAKRMRDMENLHDKPKTPVTRDEKLDDALDNSFPASDPPSQTDPQRSIKKKPPTEPDQGGQKPTGA